MFVTNKRLFLCFFGTLVIVFVVSIIVGRLGFPSDQLFAASSIMSMGSQDLQDTSYFLRMEDVETNKLKESNATKMPPKSHESMTKGQIFNHTLSIDDGRGDSKTDITVENTRQERYLLPIHYYFSGPNFLYRQYKYAIVMAMYQKRSIVELPFPDHFGQHADDKISRLHKFNATFDVDELNSAVSTISIDDFKKRCNDGVDAVLITPLRPSDENVSRVYETYEMHREAFALLHGIRLPKGSKVPTKTVLYSDGSEPQIEEMKCLGIYSLVKFGHVNLPDRESLTSRMLNHLRRAQKIREMAHKTVEKLCENGNYLAIHWRNKSGEGCRPNRPGPCHDSVRAFNENAKNIIPDIKVLMAEHGLSCVYVAHDTYSKEIVRILQKGTVPRVYDQDSILTPNGTDMAMFQDPYFMSLLEQEICLQSGLFLSTTNSNWSSFVTAVMRLQKLPEIQMERLPSWNPVPKKRRL
ncbi:uncharacterized protein [Ptychodera flava]|uniref:uncharacterized protein isoform X2 n=1 Tax=Ptychodera flava TaxID=63121 RepID=UPI003969E528